MNTSTRESAAPRQGSSVLRRPGAVAIVMLLLIGSFYLLREHWGHVAGAWPYMLLLACPLMHLMHGHGRHGHHAHHTRTDVNDRTSPPRE